VSVTVQGSTLAALFGVRLVYPERFFAKGRRFSLRLGSQSIPKVVAGLQLALT
jgi:hypothetical protein